MRGRTRLTAVLTAVLLATAVPAVADTPAPGSGPTGPTGPTAPPPDAPAYAMDELYVNPSSPPAAWVRDNPGDPRAARIEEAISSRPIARWFGDESAIGDSVAGYVGAARSHGKLPVLVAYNLPGRDACGGHSGGGAGSVGAYRTWVATFAAGVADRPAVVVLEPDALGDFACMDEEAVQDRLGMLRYATEMFAQKAPQALVYVDGGNANWTSPTTMAARLDAAGVRNVRGFSVNVSNYYPTEQSVAYARDVNQALGYQARYVVDTSRNGHGSSGEWCNPAGRKLGQPPGPGTDAELLLWVKTPGSSDGTCGIAPDTPAGVFHPDLAIGLIDGT